MRTQSRGGQRRDVEEEHAGKPWSLKILSRVLRASQFSSSPSASSCFSFFQQLLRRSSCGIANSFVYQPSSEAPIAAADRDHPFVAP
jgi:hypothetical protein